MMAHRSEPQSGLRGQEGFGDSVTVTFSFDIYEDDAISFSLLSFFWLIWRIFFATGGVFVLTSRWDTPSSGFVISFGVQGVTCSLAVVVAGERGMNVYRRLV
jgi:hypothetical protein